MIELQEINFDYESEKIFADFSLNFARDTVTAIVGPSGCGKSTLLEICALLLSPQKGLVLYNGSEVNEQDCGRQSVGYFFQSDVVLPWARVIDNVLMPKRSRNICTKEDQQHAMELLRKVGLQGYERRYPSELSGGQRQRVALAQMLFMDPSFLLLDEPMARLDFQTKLVLESLLSDLLRKGNRKTTIFITHDIESALALSDRIICLGREAGRPLEVLLDIPVDIPTEERVPELAREHPVVRRIFNQVWTCLRPLNQT
jgi:NitT/TauT family transport system ATP-binding protein